jgi:large subunit ribosomal protein L4e
MAEEKETKKKTGTKAKKPRKMESKSAGAKRPSKAKKPKAKKVKAKKLKHPPKETKGVEINVYSLDGKVKGSSELPDAFHSEIRPDLIKRAVVAFLSNKRQPYGASPTAGMRHSVETWGKGRGVSRVPRVKDEFRGAQAPGTVGGRRAHPPKAKSWKMKINRKERRAAKFAALSATASFELVSERGHMVQPKATLPVIVEDGFEELDTTKDVIKALTKLKLYDDVLRAERGTHMRAGRGKMRSRKFRTPRSLLVVVSEFKGIERGLKNLPGIELTKPEGLNAELLAPGGLPGRLTLFTESALEKVRGWKP